MTSANAASSPATVSASAAERAARQTASTASHSPVTSTPAAISM